MIGQIYSPIYKNSELLRKFPPNTLLFHPICLLFFGFFPPNTIIPYHTFIFLEQMSTQYGYSIPYGYQILQSTLFTTNCLYLTLLKTYPKAPQIIQKRYRCLSQLTLVTIYRTISTITSVCPCGVRPVFVRHKNFFSLKSLWNHPLTAGVDPRG